MAAIDLLVRHGLPANQPGQRTESVELRPVIQNLIEPTRAISDAARIGQDHELVPLYYSRRDLTISSGKRLGQIDSTGIKRAAHDNPVKWSAT